MRYGFTTGSCAAAAAKAAAYMLLLGKEKKEISIDTPKGIVYHADVEEISRSEHAVSCAVRKDAGDDPDVTHGALVYAKVTDRVPENLETHENLSKDRLDVECSWETQILIEGGVGIGRVTKPGLDQPVGNAAINRVPRSMIRKEVEEVCQLADYRGSLYVEISIPQGVELAKKTFNPRLGIVGGISVLGTTGIVEPMSMQALLAAIATELRMKRACGATAIAISPGNYGQDFLQQTFGYDLDRSVKCSNFIGDTIDMAAEQGFQQILLLGHIGKLIKVSGGIMNTHSKEGDCRMELLAAAGIRQKVPVDVLEEILGCVSTEAALEVLERCQKRQPVMEDVMEHIMFYLNKRAAGRLEIHCITYSTELGELAASPGAHGLLQRLTDEEK
ncbi:MAG: cobalt-precorrin-5B (C(1))-methyltransferase CbiD [Roseburia sp.]